MRVDADGRVLRALGVVLGEDARRSSLRLDRQALKTAFRKQAHLVHPDKALAMGLSEQALAQRFRELKHAYDYLIALLGVGAAVAVNVTTRRPSNGRSAATPDSARPAGPAPRTATCSRPAPARHPDAEASCPSSGGIPRRRLRFAQYLYYARVIDWNTLLRAMRWQHRTRPCLGEIAREMGLLSVDEVLYILRRKRFDERFGEAALRLGRLDHVRLLTILGHQHRLERPIGRYFVEQNIFTPAQLEDWLRRHWAHNLSVAAAEMRARRSDGRGSGKAARHVAVR